jgi:hypothetical protein
MKTIKSLLLGLILLGNGYLAEACPVCFGAEGDPVTEAAGFSIMFLFVFVVLMLSGVVGFFYVIMKRSSEHQTLVNALGYDPES